MSEEKINMRRMEVQDTCTNHNHKAQTTIEYLMSYTWAILLILIVAALLFMLLLVPTYVTPSSCTFTNGAYCRSAIFGSNPSGSRIGLFFTNTQEYPVIAPNVVINVTGTVVTGACKPYLIIPGGAIICYAAFPDNGIPLSTLKSGKIYFSAITCQSGDVNSCNSLPIQTYVGSFNSHVSQLLDEAPLTINVIAMNQTQTADGSKDKLNATVTMYGHPLLGATVGFTSNIPVTLNPGVSASDSYGNATSYISSMQTGNVLVTATFADVSANTVVSFS